MSHGLSAQCALHSLATQRLDIDEMRRAQRNSRNPQLSGVASPSAPGEGASSAVRASSMAAKRGSEANADSSFVCPNAWRYGEEAATVERHKREVTIGRHG